MRGLDAATQELVSRPVADNPTTSQQLDATAPQALHAVAAAAPRARQTSEITASEALSWAHLFNLRYRMLLVDIVNVFGLTGPLDNSDTTSARGGVINRTFAEMYNLRAIAGVLVQLPLDANGHSHAGPPFEMPYTLDLPLQSRDRWIQQRELFRASQILIDQTRRLAPPERQGFLVALRDSDAGALDQIARIISGR
jgi:hypothetical protein